jgi:hypothetical protein
MSDIRKMWQFYRMLYKDDADKLSKIQEMQTYFEKLVPNLEIENKPLVVPPVPVLEATPTPAPQRPST